MSRPESRTLSAFERMLRGLLVTGAVTVKVGTLKSCSARVDFGSKPYRITLDPFQAGLLDGLIHELLHVAEYDRLEGWGALEEPMTDTAEDRIVRFIGKSKARVAWWRARIAEALDHEI